MAFAISADADGSEDILIVTIGIGIPGLLVCLLLDQGIRSATFRQMILSRLRTNLDIMLSPVTDRPGLLIRDRFRYSDATLIIPPLLIPGLLLFDGMRTDLDLQAELTRSVGSPEIGNAAEHLIEALSQAGFLEDETYARLKQARLLAFTESPVRAGGSCGVRISKGNRAAARRDAAAIWRERLRPRQGVMGIAAPHISPQGGWQSYRAAYQGTNAGSA